MKEIKRTTLMPPEAKFVSRDTLILFWKRKPKLNSHNLFSVHRNKPIIANLDGTTVDLARGEFAALVD